MKISWWLALGVVGAVACSDSGPATTPDKSDLETDDGNEDSPPDDENEDEDDAPPRRDSGVRLDGGRDSGSKPDQKPDGGTTTPLPAASTGLPCAVDQILTSKCQSCHGAELAYGAPMSLTSHDDLMKENAKGRAYADGVEARIGGSERPVMPPPGNPELTEEEKKTLMDWVGAGAPKSTEKCSMPDQPEMPSPDDETPTVEDCDVTMEFRAGHDEPFSVPTTPDYYHCFYFKPDFDETTVGKGFIPVIDNKAVIHHWLLFVRDDASKRAGTSERCSGVNPGATLIAGWAPGGENTVAPKDVGIQLPRGPNVVYQLELHYNNTMGPGAKDHSGVKLCATNKPQKEMAAIHYLGSENIIAPPGMSTAGSTCRPTAPVTLLSVNPHMHKSGYHAKMVINRKNGTKETYHDAPFSFESQITYNKTAKLEQGDSIYAECTFKNDSTRIKTFAEGTEDEMCYLFTLAYPIGAMDTGSDLLGVGLPGPNRCMK